MTWLLHARPHQKSKMNHRAQPALFLLPLVLHFSCSLFVSSTLPSFPSFFFFLLLLGFRVLQHGWLLKPQSQSRVRVLVVCKRTLRFCAHLCAEESVTLSCDIVKWLQWIGNCVQSVRVRMCTCVCECTMRQVVGEEAVRQAAAACGV